MAAPLNERFCLKNDRKNFTINFRDNHEDRAAYFGNSGINEEIIEDIRERYMMGSQPKKFLIRSVWSWKDTYIVQHQIRA